MEEFELNLNADVISRMIAAMIAADLSEGRIPLAEFNDFDEVVGMATILAIKVMIKYQGVAEKDAFDTVMGEGVHAEFVKFRDNFEGADGVKEE